MNICKKMISTIMLVGVFFAAIVMALGTAIFLRFHWHDLPGDHFFHGEPLFLRNPVDIFLWALKGHDQSFLQFGVLLLLINPLIRVASALIGYIFDKDILYSILCAIVLCVLCISFFL